MSEIKQTPYTDDSAEQSVGITFSLSDDAKSIARTMSADGHGSISHDVKPFSDMLDAIRFAITLGIYLFAEKVPPLIEKPSRTLFNMGSLDPNGTLRKAIEVLSPSMLEQESLSRLLRRYAEVGLIEMQRLYEQHDGTFDLEVVIADVIATQGTKG